MKKTIIFLATFVIVLLTVTVWGSAEENEKNPVAVSPGSESAVSKILAEEDGIKLPIAKDPSNTVLGLHAGENIDTGIENTFVGYYAGKETTSGSFNSYFGTLAGAANTTGSHNLILGHNAGMEITSGSFNSFVGAFAGQHNNTGFNNLFLGTYAGWNNTIGYSNTILGHYAGYDNIMGWGNVFIGYGAGHNETGSNKLYIANSYSDAIPPEPPLIYGEFNTHIVKIHSKLGINITASPTHLIDVGNAGAYCDSGAWIDGSSRQFKNNIRDMTADEATEALNGLNPVKFYYKENETEEFLGFIAEDVPDLVATNDRKGLSPMDITAVLTKVVQKQQSLIQDYRKLISDLQERVATLEKK